MNTHTLKISLVASSATAIIMLLIFYVSGASLNPINQSKFDASLHTQANAKINCEDYKMQCDVSDKQAHLLFTDNNSERNLLETASSYPLINSTLNKQDDTTSPTCKVECLQSLLDSIAQGEQSGAGDIQISGKQAQALAEILSQQPDLLNQAEAAIGLSRITEEREHLLFILSKLPKDMLMESAQRLSYSATAQERLAGLSLLEASLGEGSYIADELNSFISLEPDSKVKIRALKVLEELPPADVDARMLDTLTQLMENNEDSKLQSAAMLAKITLTPTDDGVSNDIQKVLQAPSESLNLLGLQGLSKVLERQQYDQQRGNWHQNQDFKTHVQNIANDEKATLALRIEALQVLDRHFSD